MKCPNCDYIHGEYWIDEKCIMVEGEYGDFYHINNGVCMERTENYGRGEFKQYLSIVGCPKCNSIFMEH